MKRGVKVVQVREDLLQKVDRIVDGVLIRSRTHAIEIAITEFIKRHKSSNRPEAAEPGLARSKEA